MGIRHKIGRDKKIVFVRAPGREREREFRVVSSAQLISKVSWPSI